MPNAVVQEEQTLVYVRFRPAWTYIDGIREFGRFFCERTFDPGIADRATTILQETLENAVKYSSQDSEVELSLESDRHYLKITVISTPSAEHLASLRSELEFVNSLPPEQAYLAAFSRAADNPGASSRIGLARVRLEGSVDLQMEELEHGRIKVTARGMLSPPSQ